METPSPAGASDETAAVRAANLAYYTALTTRDLAAMEKVWTCAADNMIIAPPVKPHAHVGWEAIKQYWNDYWPTFEKFSVSMHVTGISIIGPVAWVNGVETSSRRKKTGEESSSRNYGTNIFVKQGDHWLMAFHQSALMPDNPPASAE